MPNRIETYSQAFNYLGITPNPKIRSIIQKLESEGRSEKSICFALWKSCDKIRSFTHNDRFYSVFENEIKKWSWNKNDSRWIDYNKRKAEEQSALEFQKQKEKEDKINAEYKKKYPGFVYFVQGENGGAVKIGYTIDIKVRLKQLQTGYPDNLKILTIFPGSQADEQSLHEKFSEYRLHGEWFKPCEDILNQVTIAR